MCKSDVTVCFVANTNNFFSQNVSCSSHPETVRLPQTQQHLPRDCFLFLKWFINTVPSSHDVKMRDTCISCACTSIQLCK